jgi:hypothetical protein
LREAIISHPHHLLSSVKKWGGTAADYQPILDWFDESKKIIADFRHGPTASRPGHLHLEEIREAWVGAEHAFGALERLNAI